MTKEEFWIIFNENMWLYFSIISLSFSTLMVLIFPLVRSLLHPLFFYYILNYSFAIAAVIFLYILDYISSYLFKYFIAAQILFILGLYFVNFFRRSNLVVVGSSSSSSSRPFEFVYAFSAVLFILFTFVTYLFFGLPVLEGSRWELYQDVPGAGLIGRFLEAAKFVIIFYLINKYLDADKRLSKSDLLVFFVLIFSGFLSGSKMAIFEYIFMAYVAFLYIPKRSKIVLFKIDSKVLLFSLIALGSSVTVIFLNQYFVNNNVVNPFSLIFDRFVMSGDLQILGYSNDVISQLNAVPPGVFESIFLDFKTAFGIFGVDFMSRSLGLEVMYFHYPSLDGVVNTGPSSTFETLFLYSFGLQIGLALSLLVGIVIGLAFFDSKQSKDINRSLLKAGLSFCVIFLIYNPQIAIGKIFFFVVYLLVLQVFYYLIVSGSLNSKESSNSVKE